MSQDPRKKELFEFMSQLRDGVMAYDHIVEALQRLRSHTASPVLRMALSSYSASSKDMARMHENIKQLDDYPQPGAISNYLDSQRPQVIDHMRETLEGVKDAIAVYSKEGTSISGAVRSFKNAKMKLESALKASDKETGQSLN